MNAGSGGAPVNVVAYTRACPATTTLGVLERPEGPNPTHRGPVRASHASSGEPGRARQPLWPSPPWPRPLSAVRTLTSTFRASLTSTVRAYTLSGWTVSSILAPVFLFAGAWVAVNFVAPGGSPSRFVELTGYPDYVAFVVLGTAFYGIASGALEDGGNAIYEEESNGTWELLSLAPFNRFVWMFAKTLASLLTGFIEFFAVLALGAAFFDASPTPGGLLVALVGSVLTLLALQGFGFLMAALGLVWKQPYAVAFLLSPPLILLSGMVFPVAILPGWLQAISQVIPLTHGLTIVRDAILLDRGFAELLPVFGRLVLTGAAFMAVGYAAFRFMETKARTLGVLGRY